MFTGTLGSVGGGVGGDDVIHDQHEIGHDDGLDGGLQLVSSADVAVAFFARRWRLHAYPHQQDCAGDLQVRNSQLREREKDEDDAQDDGARRAPEDAFGALVPARAVRRRV